VRSRLGSRAICKWGGRGLYYSNLHSGYITRTDVGFVPIRLSPYGRSPSPGIAPVAESIHLRAIAGSNPEGIMFKHNNNPNISTESDLRERGVQLTPTLKLTAPDAFYKFDIGNTSNTRPWQTASG